MSDVRFAPLASVSARQAVLAVVVLCLSVPVVLAHAAGVEIPLSDLVVLLGALLYWAVPPITEKLLFTGAVGAAVLVAAWTGAMEVRGEGQHPYMSIAYFFRPYLAFFAGYYLVRRHEDLPRVLRLMAFVFAVVGVLITLSLIQSGQPVRIQRIAEIDGRTAIGSALAGSVLGLPLYATLGVISLAVYYATMLIVTVVCLWYAPPRRAAAVAWYWTGVACLLYLAIGSLSRTVVLGLTVFLVVSGFTVLKAGCSRRTALAVGVTVVFVVLVTGMLYVGEIGESSWSATIRRNVESLQEGDVDAFSSRRVPLVTAALGDLLRNPIAASGFHGFRGLEDNPNSSPHNQYLTAMWKMGLPAACLYFGFLYCCARNLHALRKRHGPRSVYSGLWALVLAYGMGFCMTWDVLLVPLTGAFMMFLLGAVARVVRSERRGAASVPARVMPSADGASSLSQWRDGER